MLPQVFLSVFVFRYKIVSNIRETIIINFYCNVPVSFNNLWITNEAHRAQATPMVLRNDA
jgi:hypothetical protein